MTDGWASQSASCRLFGSRCYRSLSYIEFRPESTVLPIWSRTTYRTLHEASRRSPPSAPVTDRARRVIRSSKDSEPASLPEFENPSIAPTSKRGREWTKTRYAALGLGRPWLHLAQRDAPWPWCSQLPDFVPKHQSPSGFGPHMSDSQVPRRRRPPAKVHLRGEGSDGGE
jgi:hypothetical protein